MDDYLSKPIEERDLWRILARWLRLAAVEPVRASAPTAVGTSTLPVWPGLDVASALARLNGKHALLWRLLDEFRQRYQHAARELAEICAQGELRAAAARAHAIKGAAATLGATALADAAQQLEQALDQALPAQPALAALQVALDQLQAFPLPLANLAAPPKRADWQSGIFLDALAKALSEQRFDALKLLDAVPLDVADWPALRQLRGALDRLDFAAAQTHLAALKTLFEEASSCETPP